MTRAWHALVAYLGITLVATWPLALGLGRDVAWDLGDSLLVMWAIGWDCEQLLHILAGDVGRIATFFDANIFHPAPLTLAYSEHFIAQAIQVLPIYALTDNPILCYNLLFLSTFVLSGLGTYLFVRELTGNGPAAFIAGLLFAFAPYRIPQSSHLQVLSAQWMPFVLYGFRRYFDTQRATWLAAGAAALVVQNLSCGYYLLFFSPVAAAYVVWEMTSRGLLTSRRHWIQLSLAGLATSLLTVPFLLPYAAVHDQLELGRARGEVMRFSADVYAYATAFSGQWFWGSIANAYRNPEGDLFPGVATLALAVLGIIAGRQRTDRPDDAQAAGGSSPSLASTSRWRVPTARSFVVLSAVHLIAAVWTLAVRRVTLHVGLFDLRMSDVNQLILRAAIAFVIALLLWPALRTRTTRFLCSRGFFVVTLIVAVWLSLGPAPRALGRPVDLFGLYGLLLDHVPGFDGVRVPARFGMIVVLMLAVLGGLGADVIARRRRGHLVLVVAALVLLAESLSFPFVVNGTVPPEGFNAPEARVRRPSRAPAVYAQVAQLPPGSVLAELPLGHPDFDVRAVFYSTAHWRPLLNGYSGFFPRSYGQLTLALSDVPRHPDIARDALRTSGATHVLVHESAYLGDQGVNTSAVLEAAGARELFRGDGDVLLALPR